MSFNQPTTESSTTNTSNTNNTNNTNNTSRANLVELFDKINEKYGLKKIRDEKIPTPKVSNSVIEAYEEIRKKYYGKKINKLEKVGFDPTTSRMQSGRSTI